MVEVGIVAIGRNEGERLRRCLESVAGQAAAVVYVDSGSTDGSVDRARDLGVEVVELDLSTPFTAARARNAGFERLMEIAPGLEFVQFVDGDCEVSPGWLGRGASAMRERPDVAVVAGRCRERRREATVYNRLADLEWDMPIGEAEDCGGNAMMRAGVFRGAGGFDPTIIAGEEPDLCVRLRRDGWKVLRIDAEMVVHDMAMTRFTQWWRRAVRSGHAYAEGASRHGRGPERHWVHQARSCLFWGVGVPAAMAASVAAAAVWPAAGLGALAVLASGYPALYLKTVRYYRRVRGWPPADARVYAAACTLAKLPQAIGGVKYHAGPLLGRPSRIIEFKGAEPRTATTTP